MRPEENTMNIYLVDITIRVKAETSEGAYYLATQRAQRAFDEALMSVSQPELDIIATAKLAKAVRDEAAR